MVMLAGAILGQALEYLRRQHLHAPGDDIPYRALRIVHGLLSDGRGRFCYRRSLFDKLYKGLLDGK
jgi:hypothetical protein